MVTHKLRADRRPKLRIYVPACSRVKRKLPPAGLLGGHGRERYLYRAAAAEGTGPFSLAAAAHLPELAMEPAALVPEEKESG
ncbi:protein of unknown function [Methylacidimicrobium sp. AP8]|nr:protein of unknown function [Methylacidimicrobium sp. AP8]